MQHKRTKKWKKKIRNQKKRLKKMLGKLTLVRPKHGIHRPRSASGNYKTPLLEEQD
jgi:hypothetical protein